jgi:hypothetical protein
MELKYQSLKINKNVLMQWVCQSLHQPDAVHESTFGVSEMFVLIN